jgi:hypothetical protein
LSAKSLLSQTLRVENLRQTTEASFFDLLDRLTAREILNALKEALGKATLLGSAGLVRAGCGSPTAASVFNRTK